MTAPGHPDPSIQAQLEEFARRYREQLPAKFGEIAAAWRALQSSWDQDTAETLYRTVHNMAGAAGTMGLRHVGDAARTVEQRLKPLLAEPARLPDVAVAIAGAIAALEAAISGNELPSHAIGHAVLDELPPLKILVAEDEPLGRQVLCTLLEAWGHTVFGAEDGEQAVALFLREAPDMVLMDVVMPGMDGYMAAHAIKQACGRRFVPLIFLTALQEDQDLTRCVAAGGDDFMVKPYSGTLLQAKLIAMNRIRLLHRELSLYREKTAEEIELSKHVFDAITGRNPVLPEIGSEQASVGHFCGDLLLYDKTPRGRLVLMLGDFTGHGLAAAIGALPAAEAFYPMAARDEPLESIVSEINERLHNLLPTGRFCAAVFLDIDSAKQRIRYWNGGSPPCWLCNRNGRVSGGIASTKLPLGIVGRDGFDGQVEEIAAADLSAVVLYSDGLSEVRNPQGEMLSEEGVRQVVATADSGDLLESVRAGCDRFRAGRVPEDDLSLVVVRLG